MKKNVYKRKEERKRCKNDFNCFAKITSWNKITNHDQAKKTLILFSSWRVSSESNKKKCQAVFELLLDNELLKLKLLLKMKCLRSNIFIKRDTDLQNFIIGILAVRNKSAISFCAAFANFYQISNWDNGIDLIEKQIYLCNGIGWSSEHLDLLFHWS